MTWTRDADERLRGCIGSLEAQPLRAGLPATALTSALRDRRFAPVSRDELPRLRCTVSLLHQYEALAAGPGAWQDWTVGVHGLTLRFSDPSPAAPARRYCATYLPEVAKAEGWSRRTAVESLVRKAGFSGPVDSRLLAALQVTRYQSSRCACTYDQWAAGGGGLPN